MTCQVRVLNTSHVRPVQTDDGLSPPYHGELKLSLFDAPHIPKKIRRLFFFDGPDLPPFPSIVSALRSSLAATLGVFLPLAGNLAFRPASGDVVLDFSPAAVSSGVTFVEAEFSGGADGMRRLTRDAEHDTRAFALLVPELEARQLPAPVLAVQVTGTGPADAGGGAVAVGVSFCHAVADGHAVWMFLRAWSTASREGSGALAAAAAFVRPTFDRDGIRHPRADEVVRTMLSLVAPELPLLRSVAPSKPEMEMMQHRRRTFLLHADEILSLKQHILEHSSSSSASSKPPSTYVAISSLAWASVVRATPSVHDDDEVQFMVSADCRNRLRPPLGDAFFGNCIKPCFARARAGDLRLRGGEGAAGVVRAAAAIQDAIRVQLDGELGDDPLWDAESWMASIAAVPPERLVSLASSHRFMAYETDFGWGAPTRVELVPPLFVRHHVALLGAKNGAVQVSVTFDGAAAMETFAASFVVPHSSVVSAFAWPRSSNTSASASLSRGER